MINHCNDLYIGNIPIVNGKTELKHLKYTSNQPDSKLEKLNSIHLRCTRKPKYKLPRHTQTSLPRVDIKRLKFQQKFNAALTFLISCLVVGASIYESESLFKNKYELDSGNDIIRLFITCLAALEAVLVIFYYLNILKIKISYQILSKYSAFYQDKETLLKLILELAICVIITPPYLNYVFTTRQLNVTQTLSLNEVLLALIFFKTFFLFKFFYEFSFYNSIKSQFYCNLSAISNKFTFTMRCILKSRPFSSILLIFLLSTNIFGVLLHTYEESIEFSPFISYWNSIWLVSYTQSTIGYGDIVPQTHLGRLTIIATIFVGLFLYSYMTVIVKIITGLSTKQYKLYSEIKSKKISAPKMKKISVVFIQRWWKLIIKRKKKLNSVFQLNQFNNQSRVFSYYRIQLHQEKAQTLELCISKILNDPIKKMKSLSQSFKSIDKSEMLSLRFANLNYGKLQKIKRLNKYLRTILLPSFSLYNNEFLSVIPKHKRLSKTGSKASLHKLKSEAMKNMMKKRYSKSIISHSLISFSSEHSESPLTLNP